MPVIPRPIRKSGVIQRRPDGGLLLVEADGLIWRVDCDVDQHIRLMYLLGNRVTLSGQPYNEVWFSIVSILAPAAPCAFDKGTDLHDRVAAEVAVQIANHQPR